MTFIIGAAHCFYLASGNIHKKVLQNILKAKMAFFDTKPLGMILNRFSKDMDTVGKQLQTTFCFCELIGNYLLIENTTTNSINANVICT